MLLLAPCLSGQAIAEAPVLTENSDYTLVGRGACPQNELECVTLAVAKDHSAADGATLEITYAIKPAAGEKLGTLIIMTGGPGGSAIDEAEDWIAYMPSAILKAYDVVFPDQRGTGLSYPIACPDATAAYHARFLSAEFETERVAAVAAAATFATDCVAETGVPPDDLSLFSTASAVHDLEAIRRQLGVERLHLYGLSYGTKYVQQYAAAYPEHIASLILDGAVDLSRTGLEFSIEAALGAEDVMLRSFEACSGSEACKADFVGGSALEVYDGVAAKLREGPFSFSYPVRDGSLVRRELLASDFEYAALVQLYRPEDRMVFLRALASTSKGNFRPLADLVYSAMGRNPEAPDVSTISGASDAAYDAVECADNAYFPGSASVTERLDAWVAVSKQVLEGARHAWGYYSRLPCLFWPEALRADPRPALLTDTDYPVFILSSTTDPATPFAGALRIHKRMSNSYLLQTIGGRHGSFAWEHECPDHAIAAYLVKGALPETSVTTCPGSVISEYLPTATMSVSEYSDALELMESIENQIRNSDAYQYRLMGKTLTVGCDFGGTITYAATVTGISMSLDKCGYVPDWPMTGTGKVDETGSFALIVTSGNDKLSYQRDAGGTGAVSGVFRG
jgi:pimeloyl-ACP methyl ester carboxylesterase